MKVLLVNPLFPTTFWSFKHALKFVSKKAACPPLGLLTVASMLPEDWDVRLIDLNVGKLKDRDLENIDCVMISGMLIQQASADDVLDRCRQAGVKIIAGGPLFTSKPDDYMDRVDHLVLDEAELTLPMFLKDLANGVPKKVYRSEGFPDLSLTPPPRWDLIRVKDYQTMLIQSSRGCPFNCEFCDITNLFGRIPRVKQPDQLIDELDAIYNLGWRGQLFFVDDNFIGNKKQIKRFLPRLTDWMESRDRPFSFTTEASLNLADDDELIELMVRAGFDTVFIGLETPNENSLKECGKNHNRRMDMVEAVKKLQRSGMQVLGGYIVGFDNDDESIFSRQIKFIQESGVVAAMVGLLNAPPNTRLWKRLKKENRLIEDASGDNTDGSINFIPAMNREALIEGYRRIVKTIYSPRQYYRRVCNFLEEYRPQHPKKLRIGEIKAFLRTLFYLGVLGNGASQFYYWKLLFKSAFQYRNSFSEAMTLMVYGRHFRIVSRKV